MIEVVVIAYLMQDFFLSAYITSKLLPELKWLLERILYFMQDFL